MGNPRTTDSLWRASLVREFDFIAFIGLIGVTAGFVEALLKLFGALRRGHFMFTNEHFLWMTPLAEGVVFLFLGLPLLVLACFVGRRSRLLVGSGLLSFVATFLIMYRYVTNWAAFALALGVAFQAVRCLDRNPDCCRWLVRNIGPWQALGIVLLALASFGRRWWLDAQAVASVPTPRTEAANVVLIVLDTVRADSIRINTEHSLAPRIGSLAATGLFCSEAYAPAPWTLPTHASLFTGRHPHELTAGWYSPLDDSYPTLAEVFSTHGYATAGFVANTSFCSRATGLDRGFSHYEDYQLSLAEILSHSEIMRLIAFTRPGFSLLGIYDELGRKSGAEITDACLEWVAAQERPYFAFLNYFDAHDPYLPEQLVSQQRPLTHEEKLRMRNWWRNTPDNLSVQELNFARSCYDSKIVELDEYVGRLLDGLVQRSRSDNTLIIITSDHGELFGEHGVVYHGNNLYEPVVHVPLFAAFPGEIPAGVQISTALTLKDLPATILDLVGIQDSRILGQSLRPLLQNDRSAAVPAVSPLVSTVKPHPRPDVFPLHRYSPARYGEMNSVLDDGDYLIRQANGVERLYAFQSGPSENVDIAADEAHQDRLQELRELLDRLLHVLKEQK